MTDYVTRQALNISLFIVLFILKPNGLLLSRETRRHDKKMAFYFLIMLRIAVDSNAFDRWSAERGTCQKRTQQQADRMERGAVHPIIVNRWKIFHDIRACIWKNSPPISILSFNYVKYPLKRFISY